MIRKTKLFIRYLMRFVLGRVFYETIMMYHAHGYWPNLHHPRTLNEKIANLKLFTTPPLAHILADKYLVREYVKDKELAHILNRLYYVGNDPQAIPFDTLPQRYVIRFSHNSGGVIFVNEKNSADRKEIIKKCASELKKKFGYLTNEDWYLKIVPRLIVEEMIEDGDNAVPPDYKFYIINGKIAFISATHGRFENMHIRYYTPEWDPLDFSWGHPIGEPTPPPANIEEMKYVALKLADQNNLVRVDLYSLNGNQIRFGEITFADGAGWDKIIPTAADFIWGYFGEKQNIGQHINAFK